MSNLKKSTQRLLSLLLTLTLIVSLSGCGMIPGFGNHVPTAEEEQQRFDEYTDEVFLSEVQLNIINLHFTLAHPEEYGIEDYEVTLGSFSEEDDKESYDLIRGYIQELEGFDYDLLTPEQQLSYDIFMMYSKDALKREDFRLYNNYLSPTTGMQSYIPTLLAEYTFYSEKDVTDYLEILELLPSYFEDLMAFEKEQSEAGFFMPDFEVDKVVEQCEQFMADPENHYLIDSFNLRIDETDFLEDATKEDYKAQNVLLMQKSVIPAFDYLVTELKKLKGTGLNDRGLEAFENGQKFYELLVRDSTGSDKSVEEIQQLIIDRYYSALEEILNLTMEDEDVFERMDDCPIDLSDPYTVLNHLNTEITTDFPTPADLPFEVNYVPESMEEYTNPAYYILPPIDDLQNNIIYINRGNLTGGTEDFVTLAHEGFPGHLYQTTYFYGKNPSKIRKLFSFSGYSEGWGTYAEMYAYSLSQMDDAAIRLNELNKIYTFSIYCLADIGINYDGWSYEETIDFFNSMGLEEEVGREIFQAMVEDPALYLAYYLGYLEFMELRAEAESTLGEAFNLKDFHTFLLDIGPAQFEIIAQRMQMWIEEQSDTIASQQALAG